MKRTAKTLIAALLLLSLAGPACTIIRYVDDDQDDGGDMGAPPAVMDLLVIVDLDRSVSSLSESYQEILTQLIAGLLAKNITVRHAALAPLYRRTGGVVPLLYGQNDQNAEFSSFGEAVAFFALDDGQRYLRESVEADGENLATLGLDLGTRPIYHPTTADTDGSPYFTTPEDGLIVVTITARQRGCAYDEVACQLSGQPAASYFTATGAQGDASWLVMGNGESLPPERIFHLSIATREGLDETSFVNQCKLNVGFPQSKLDFMEPSPRAYYQPFVSSVTSAGGNARFLDLCVAMSGAGPQELIAFATNVRAKL